MHCRMKFTEGRSLSKQDNPTLNSNSLLMNKIPPFESISSELSIKNTWQFHWRVAALPVFNNHNILQTNELSNQFMNCAYLF